MSARNDTNSGVLTDDQIRRYVLARGYERARPVILEIAEGVRTCSICKTKKPLDQFPADPDTALGISPHCDVCNRGGKIAEVIAAYRAKVGGKPKELECGRCKETKPLTSDYWPSKRSGELVVGTFPLCSKCVK